MLEKINSKRIISSIVLLILVLIILILGNQIIVDIACGLVAAICLHEYYKCLKKKANPVKWIGYLSAIFICIAHIIPEENRLDIFIITIPIIIMLLFLKSIATNLKVTITDISVTLFGVAYISLFIMFIPLLRNVENGKILVWFIFLSAWGTDIFAYIVGKKVGKHKFSKISPNKTIEGCIGGIIGSIILVSIYSIICNKCFELNLSYIYMIFVAIVLSIVGQLGDFAASSIKRYAEIKDFSNLIPGHGGLLDRIDSVIFIAPVTYILLVLL